MKLYEYEIAPNARRVNIFLAEIELSIERVHVDIRAGENLSPEFKAKAPNGLIPYLELEDGTCIGESVAICRYLESVSGHSDDSLFGNSPLEVANIEMWHRLVEFQVTIPALQAFRNISGIYSDRENTNPEWGAESKQRYLNILPTLEQQLAQNPYLAGDKFSVADISLFCIINFMRVLKLTLADDLPHLNRWLNAMRARESIINTEPQRA